MNALKNIAYGMFLFVSFTYGCSGDCVACHETLKKTLDAPHHKPIKTCIQCHKDDNVSNMGSACGKDCFECHDKRKVIASDIMEHKAIKECIQCHRESPKNALFEFEKNDLPFLRNFIDRSKPSQAGNGQ